MADWVERVRIRVGAVSLDIPAVLVKNQDAPIDSAAAIFEGDGLTVLIDQGPFADRLDHYDGRPGFREETTIIDGKPVRVVFFHDPDAKHETTAIHLPPPHATTVVVQADASVPEHVPREIVNSLRLQH